MAFFEVVECWSSAGSFGQLEPASEARHAFIT